MRKISEIGGEWSFWTLTMPSAFHKLPDEQSRARFSLKSIRKNWDKFIKFMKRKYGKFQYVRVFETHESGCLHIHFLASFHIHENDYKTVYKDNLRDYSYSASMKKETAYYGWGKIHAVENLPVGDFARTVGYVTKYMTKEDDFVTRYLGKLRVRRIQTSQGIGAVPKGKSEYEWSIVTGVSRFENEMIPTIDLNRSRMITALDFEDEGFYPTMSEMIRGLNSASISDEI